jgi:HlyD family secretion protein
MKNNRLLYILLAIVLVLVGGYALGKKMGWIGKSTGTEITAATAGPATIVEKVSASGKVQPETESRPTYREKSPNSTCRRVTP